MIKAFIFDMDGVIIDSEPVHLMIEQKLCKEYGVNLTEEEHSTYIGTNSYYMWDCIKKIHNLPQSIEELVEINRAAYFNHLKSDKNLAPIEQVDKLIMDLHERGIKLALASSSPMNVIEAVVDAFKLRDYFHIMISGDEVENSKPEPDIFLCAADRLSVTPEECVVIEDSTNGVIAAKKAGMCCIGYKNLNSANQDISLADYVFDSFQLVRETIDNIIK
jgi:HAD superfamily hydrolase (TIGR01509 family)